MKKYEIKETPMPFEIGSTKAYKFGRCKVIVGIEPNIGWHMSISHHRQNPTWEEIRDARYHFVPENISMYMILPKKDEYVNVHEFCFHLHELKE